jgi:DNA-binding transcriptional LysR family regulator
MDLAAALRAFVRSVERGSITAAARDLNVTQPAVTKHLRNLEHHVGARLLERSARAIRPTAHGQTLYEASRAALASIDSALEGVRRDMGKIEGGLRIHAPPCIGVAHLHPIVMRFQQQHPAVQVDLVLEARLVDLVYENFDLSVRYGRIDDQDLIVRRFGFSRRVLVASPEFLARTGPIETPEQFADLDIVATPNVLSPRDSLTLLRGSETREVALRPRLRVTSAEALVNTLLVGHAAGPVQVLLVSEALRSGRLVRILPEWEVRPTEAFLAYPSVRFMRPVVRAFTDFAIPALRSIEGIDLRGADPLP